METVIWEPVCKDIDAAALRAMPRYDHNHTDGIKNLKTIIGFVSGAGFWTDRSAGIRYNRIISWDARGV